MDSGENPSPRVKTWHFHCCGPEFIPGQGTRIPQVAWHSQEKKHSDINCRNILFDPCLRVPKIKTKINTWDLIILKSFCTPKETKPNKNLTRTNICKGNN